MATPQIPPRPSRSTNAPSSTSAGMDIPKIPPRPKRSIERSVSPNRDTYARSPLNDPSFLHNSMKPQHKESRLSVELPPRPPSVTLPSIGQEGSEYASLEDLHSTLDPKPEQTSNVAGDLPLHAPTASLPSSTAKARVQTVTRTDSSQATAAGIGKSLFPEDKSAHPDSGSSAGTRTRPQSIIKDDDEHGIPEIGVQVPMYPNAGDVQAPTPSPYEQGGSTGVGFFNKPGGRHHSRTKSGREIFHGPPGSYGLHGHGVISNDDFEKKWYAKHPEDLKREKQGEYGPHIQENRKEYHWVGDDLVKLVHQSGGSGTGMGTSREAIGTPNEEIGYRASEEFASRMASPRPNSARPPSVSKGRRESVESPLRQMNFPVDQLEKTATRESVAEDDEDVIHIDPPAHPRNKIGGGGYDPPTEDLGPEGGNTQEEGGWINERGYGVPILASDELAKRPGAEYMQPAVSPELERRGSADYTINDADGVPSYISGRRPSSRGPSRPSSRNSIHDRNQLRSPTTNDRNNTPLESTKEYEPLFPDDDEYEKKKKHAKTPVEKLKRPDLARHHFPSQDVWEDTPSSLQLQTTVETPQVPDETATPADASSAKTFEKPEAEQSRKENITKADQQSFLPEHTKRLAKTGFNKDILGDMPLRPGMQQRFPSHDIWEDSPEYHHLSTTVNEPQTEETNEYADDSPAVTEKPQVPGRPTPPARPQKTKDISPVEKKAAPIIPDRPKPQVPARPAKPSSKSSEKVPTIEKEVELPTQPKAKPQVPARPGGSKIAALQAGFLKDLNSKLGLGPQAPKVKEPETEEEQVEVKPLQDARKGRAKGPQRRKPTSSPSPAAGAAAAAGVASGAAGAEQKLAIAGVSTLWAVDEEGSVEVPAARLAERISASLAPPQKVEEMEPQPHVAEEGAAKGEAVGLEEPELAKSVSKESAKSLSQESAKSVKSATAEAPGTPMEEEGEEDVGGVQLEKKDSAPTGADPAAAAAVEQEPTLKTEAKVEAEGEERNAV